MGSPPSGVVEGVKLGADELELSPRLIEAAAKLADPPINVRRTCAGALAICIVKRAVI